MKVSCLFYRSLWYIYAIYYIKGFPEVLSHAKWISARMYSCVLLVIFDLHGLCIYSRKYPQEIQMQKHTGELMMWPSLPLSHRSYVWKNESRRGQAVCLDVESYSTEVRRLYEHKQTKNNTKRQPLKLCMSQSRLQPGVCWCRHRHRVIYCYCTALHRAYCIALALYILMSVSK